MKAIHNFALTLMAALMCITLGFCVDYMGTHSTCDTAEGWVYTAFFMLSAMGFVAALLTFENKYK